MDWISCLVGLLNGVVCVFGDKLVFYCVMMLGVIVEGVLYIYGFFEGEDICVIVVVM